MFGISPRYDDLNWKGLDFTPQQFEQVTSIDKAAWKAELALHAELFEQLAYHLPRRASSCDQGAHRAQRLGLA